MPASTSKSAEGRGALSLPDGVSAADVRRQVQRILRSRGFAQSDRMSRFLRYCVDEAVAGRAGQLKEYGIGLEVFDRDSSYDPRTDPIVRVEARRLREKLASYYAGDGRGDQLLIELPKGRYAPRFRKAAAAAARPESSDENTIAVLPFTNLSAEAENEYFSDGLTEELIHALTKVVGLRVVAWSSAMQLKGRAIDVYEAGQRLKVSKVLEGSVRRHGERLRITVQLVNTANGHYLWSETFDRRMRDLFAIQDEISSAIVNILRVKLTGARAAPAVARGERGLEAYNHYLRGRYYWNKRTQADMFKSVSCFEEALATDPACALAYAGIADAYCVLSHHGLADPSKYIPKSRAAALKALEMDPSLAEAHTSLALIRSLHDWLWEEAEGHYRQAIELNPGYATGHLWYSVDFLALRGRMDEAFEEYSLARRLDPLTPISKETEGYLLMMARRYQEAVVAYKKLMEDEPTFYKAYTSLGRAYSVMGLYDKAIESLKKGRSIGGDVPSILGALGQTYALAGKPDMARQLLAELKELAKERYVTCTCCALIHVGLGEKQQALDLLDLACDRRELSLGALKIHPAYDALRTERRFDAILQRIGLAS